MTPPPPIRLGTYPPPKEGREPWNTANERAVRILLECILVIRKEYSVKSPGESAAENNGYRQCEI